MYSRCLTHLRYNYASSLKIRYRFGTLSLLLFFVLALTASYYYNVHESLIGYSLSSSERLSHKSATIYVLTATYSRSVQRAEMTRLCNTLKNVHNVHWVVVEDSPFKTKTIATLLEKCAVPYTHLNCETPSHLLLLPHEPYWFRPKGVVPRNCGLNWLRQTFVLGKDSGVLYIADDDNAYSLDVFDELRTTQRASTWPVAFAGELPWEGCVTDASNRSRITSIWVAFDPQRPFPIDMAGFAVNMDLLLNHPDAKFSNDQPRGMLESDFLVGLGLRDWRELEPKADGCRRILVWHTRTSPPLLATWVRLQSQGVIAPPIDEDP